MGPRKTLPSGRQGVVGVQLLQSPSAAPLSGFRMARHRLKLRSLGQNAFSVLDGEQLIGRIRLADERIPGVWIWHVQVHVPGGLPMGSCKDLGTAKAEFRAAWLALKARTPPERLAAAFKAINIRDDD